MSCEKLDNFPRQECCIFCATNVVDELKYGCIYKYGDIVTHYFCLLLSSNTEQNGKDEEGILGFLAADIVKEVQRGKKLKCSLCKKSGATLGCSVSKCKTSFHLPCGISNNTLHQFYDNFKSFCSKHRPRQKIDSSIYKQVNKKEISCGICYDDLTIDSNNALWAPCCQKSAFFHRLCVQKLANSFGSYAFRCPLCNNKNVFNKTMKTFGIYIPDRDASWEQENNAFHELLVRHNKCDNKKCICPYGRSFNKASTRWRIILCDLCGSQGVHNGCLRENSTKWECDRCLSMVPNSDSESTDTDIELNNRATSSVSETCDASNSRNSLSNLGSRKKRTLSSSSSSTSSSSSRNKKKRDEKRSRSDKQRDSKQRRSNSSDSSDVISVTRLSSPIIIIDSDDDSSDVEIVADVSNNVVVNRDGKKIEIFHIRESKETDNVEVTGDIKLQEIKCGYSVNMSANRESQEKSQWSKDKSNIWNEPKCTNVPYHQRPVKKPVPCATITSSDACQPSEPLPNATYFNVNQYNINIGNEANMSASNTINTQPVNHIISPSTFYNSQQVNNSFVDFSSSEQEKKNLITVNTYHSPSTASVLTPATNMTAENMTVFAKVPSVPSGTVIKLKNGISDSLSSQLDSTTEPNNVQIKCSNAGIDGTAQANKSRIGVNRSDIKCYRRESVRIKRKSSVHHQFGLKECAIVLEPLLLKVTKAGAIKVVRKRLKSIVSQESVRANGMCSKAVVNKPVEELKPVNTSTSVKRKRGRSFGPNEKEQNARNGSVKSKSGESRQRAISGSNLNDKQIKLDKFFSIIKQLDNVKLNSSLASKSCKNGNDCNKKLKQSTLNDIFNIKSPVVITGSREADKKIENRKRKSFWLGNNKVRFTPLKRLKLSSDAVDTGNGIISDSFKYLFSKLKTSPKAAADVDIPIQRNGSLIYVRATTLTPVKSHMSVTLEEITDYSCSIDFPFKDLNTLTKPNYVNFTTYPLSKQILDNVFSSSVKVEITKNETCKNIYSYMFFMFNNDIPVLQIVVKISCDNDTTDVGFPVKFRCLKSTLELNESLTKSKDVRDKQVPGSSNCVCFSFENDEVPASVMCKNVANDESSFFFLPSLLSFNNVQATKTILKLSLKIIKSGTISPKVCQFEIDQPLLSTDTTESDTLSKTINKNLKVDYNNVLPINNTNNCKSVNNSSNNKPTTVFNEIQNTLPRKSVVQSSDAKVTSKISKNIKKKAIKSSNNRSKFHTTQKVLKNKLKSKKSKTNLIKTNSSFKDDSKLGEVDCQDCKSKESEDSKTVCNTLEDSVISFEKTLPSEKDDKNNTTSCIKDNSFFNYLNRMSESIINSMKGIEFKPSLFERKITSFKNE